MKILSTSIQETSSLAAQVLSGILPGDKATVLALYGDLGSGKTTFVQELGKLLGITRSMQSPTFVLMKSYDISYERYKVFKHIDGYRLEKPDELAKLNFSEILADPKNIIAVEWAERVEELVPRDATRIHFTFVDEHTREIEVVE